MSYDSRNLLTFKVWQNLAGTVWTKSSLWKMMGILLLIALSVATCVAASGLQKAVVAGFGAYHCMSVRIARFAGRSVQLHPLKTCQDPRSQQQSNNSNTRWVLMNCDTLIHVATWLYYLGVAEVLVKDPAKLNVARFQRISSFLEVVVGLLLGFFLSSSMQRLEMHGNVRKWCEMP